MALSLYLRSRSFRIDILHYYQEDNINDNSETWVYLANLMHIRQYVPKNELSEKTSNIVTYMLSEHSDLTASYAKRHGN